ncbi:MAG: glycosyltransferase [Actinobacteria bacterium]|nr:glycosyltransferase [Actinomycetota bacterium]
MRIALVSNHASPMVVLGGVDAGGQNVHVAALSKALSARGTEVTVYTRRQDPGVPRRVPFHNGVTVEHVDAGPARPISKDEQFPFMEQFAAELERAWTRWRPDVVHANFWLSGYASVLGATPIGAPVVQTFHALGLVKRRHQGEMDTSPADRFPVERCLVASVDHVIATCTDEVFELRRLGGEIERITIVPCGVNLRLFRPDGRVRPRRDGWHRLVIVSRLVPRKGIDDVIRALATLPHTELLVAGGPRREDLDRDPEIARLRAVAADASVRDRVAFLGRLERHDVPPLMRSADAVVSTPWYEPFGIVPVEAMACGVPVVATAVGGMIDTIRDGVTGLHVPPKDPDAIADAVRALLDDPGRRHTMGQAGVVRARVHYSWDRIADATLSVYRAVADRDRRLAEEVSHG